MNLWNVAKTFAMWLEGCVSTSIMWQ